MSTNMAKKSGDKNNSGPWSDEEQQKLRHIANYHLRSHLQTPAPLTGERPLPWTAIAKEHGTRSAKQCRERWDNHEKTYQKTGPITTNESEYIHGWVAQNGKKWAKLSRALDRPENMIKNHYYQEFKKAQGRKARELAQEQHVHSMQQDHQDRRDRLRSMSRSISHITLPHSSHQPWPAPLHTPQDTPLDYYQQPQHYRDDYNRRPSEGLELQHSRRPSNISNPPSLASDHDSVVDSPRSGLDTWPPAQFSLPPLQLPKPVSSRPDCPQMNHPDNSRSISSQGRQFSDLNNPHYETHHTSFGTSRQHSRAPSYERYQEQPSTNAYPSASSRSFPTTVPDYPASATYFHDRAYEQRREASRAGPFQPVHHTPYSNHGDAPATHMVQDTVHDRVHDTGYQAVERHTTTAAHDGSLYDANQSNPLVRLSDAAAVSSQNEERKPHYDPLSIHFLLN